MNICGTAIIYEKDPTHAKLSDMFASCEAAGTTSYVIAVDTKSADGTLEWIQNLLGEKANVFPYVFDIDNDGTGDFSAARNRTLYTTLVLGPRHERCIDCERELHAPSRWIPGPESRLPECDWWYWVDSDDTIEMTGEQTFEEFLSTVPENVSSVYCNYDYERDQFGNSTTTHTRGRFYRSSVAWEWRRRVHEDVYPPKGLELGKDLQIMRTEDNFLWVHHLEGRESAAVRNFALLKKELEDDPDDPRTWYYLGNQFFAVKDFAKAAECFEKYIGLSGWDIEKWTALIYQAICYRSLGMLDKSIDSDTRAMHLIPEYADSYFGLGEAYTRKEDWSKARYWGELGIKRVADGDGIPPPVMFVNANAYQFNPYLWLAVAYWNLGEPDKTIACYEQAAKARPEDDLLSRISHLKWAMKRQEAVDKALWVAGFLRDINEPLKARAILENLPSGSGDEPRVRVARKMIHDEVAYLFDPVAYKNHYFEDAPEHVDPLEWVSRVDPDFPRIVWVKDKLKQAGVKKVLELGVGNALSTLYYATEGIQVVGLDIDPRRVKQANWNAVKLGLLKEVTKTLVVDEDGPVTVTVPDIHPDSIFQVHPGSFEDIPESVMALGPFDAVVASEVIEHVLDVNPLLKTLDRFPRAIITTPDGAFDGPQARNFDHVRAHSLRELGALLQERGAVVDLHKVAHPDPRDYSNLNAQYLPGKVMEGPSVVIWCPQTNQGWTPDSIAHGGIGGSETAVIRVAEELVKLGYRVKVWGECEGIWNGVSYSKTEDFQPWPCQLFVAWRNLGPIELMKGLAQYRFIWSHDVHFGPATPEQLKGVTVLALSDWHKTYLESQYPGAHLEVTANGIDPERFDLEVERQPHKLIYASSPDRGLDIVLKSFPTIKEKYPDATLDVYYGFEMARKRDPGYISQIENLAKQEGITLHGRVDQNELAKAYLSADVMLYPSVMPNGQPFTETYCISAVEAQAAGCIPITPTHGALATTNAEGIHTTDLLSALDHFWSLSKTERSKMRKKAQRWARNQTWKSVAIGWQVLMATDEVEVNLPEMAHA